MCKLSPIDEGTTGGVGCGARGTRLQARDASAFAAEVPSAQATTTPPGRHAAAGITDTDTKSDSLEVWNLRGDGGV